MVKQTLREMYARLFRGYKYIALDFGNTEGEANRIAAKGAVRNTAKEWRRQYDT